MSFKEFFDKIAWASMTLVCMYASMQLRDLTESVSKLNINVAVLISQMSALSEISTKQDKDLRELARRVDLLEK